MAEKQITGREPQLASHTIEQGKRRLSLRRLGTMLNVLPPDAVSLDATREMIESDDFYVRYNAAKLLCKRGDRDARVVIEDALSHGSARTRASVARHLYHLNWFIAEPLLRTSLSDDDPRVREAAVYALCDMRDLNAFAVLEEVLPGERDNVLDAAAFGLRDTEDPAALPTLQIVLQNGQDPDVRIRALEALGMTGLADAMPLVRQAMFDPNPHVKYAATLSLLELAGQDWLDELSGVIGRTQGETLEQVLLGFFHATNYLKIDVASTRSAELMIDALETALLDASASVRKAAVWPLAWMRHDRTASILKKTCRIEMDNDVKAHIVRVAAGLMSDASEEILHDALDSSDDTVRGVAQKVMSDRERAGFVPTYNENASDGIAMTRDMFLGRDQL